jgi:hypothetical protein
MPDKPVSQKLPVVKDYSTYKDDEGQRQEVSWCEEPFLSYLLLDLAWSSCFLFLVVLSGVVMDCQAHVVPLPLARQVMGDLCQLGEEPGQDHRKNRSMR